MNAEKYCPKCQRTLPSDGPPGLCPACLLAVGLGLPGNPQDQNLSPAPTTPSGRQSPPPAVSDLAPLFPQLEIIEILGQGGMGTVYKARQKKLDRLVALKIVRSDAAADPAFAERFNREARTLARMSHPNIVAVHDFGEVQMADIAAGPSQPLYYFLMEFVDGANLRQLMNGQRLESQQALTIVPQVCDALQYAHDEGVVHRDIKPENILVDHRGRVKIADFGLAKLVAGSSDDFTLTGTHQVMGTPRYMAPEQMEGSHAVDHRADIYSLGVVFYEMLTGQVPAGHFDPPSHKVNLDHRLDSIVLKAMARDPERRFQQASEVRTAVAPFGQTAAAHTEIAQSGNIRAEENAIGAPAISEFLSLEARAVRNWVVGKSKHSQAPQSIRMLAPLLAVVGIVCLFVPFISVRIVQQDITNNHILQFTPADHFLGLVAAAWLVTSIILEVIALTSEHSGKVLCGLRIFAASAAVLTLVLFRYTIGYTLVNVSFNTPDGRLPSVTMMSFESIGGRGHGTASLAALERITALTPSGICGAISLLALLIISVLSLRDARPQASAGRGVGARLDGAANAAGVKSATPPVPVSPSVVASRLLTAIGIVLILVALVGGFLGMFTSTVVTSQAELQQMRRTGIMILSVLGWNVLLGTCAIVCGRQIHRGAWVNICRFVCVLVIFSSNLALPVTAPLAIWCLLVLGKVRQDERALESGTNLSLADESKSGLTQLLPESLPERMQVALIVSAVLLAFSAVVVAIMAAAGFSSVPVQARNVYASVGFVQVLCLPMSILMVVSSHFVRQRRNLVLVRLVCMLGLVPITLASVVTIPITIWCLFSLYRLEPAGTLSTETLRGPMSPMRSAWISFWAERHTWTTRIVQTVLSLIFVACFIMFISFSSSSSVEYPTPGAPGVRTALVTLGHPTPWFEYSKNRNGHLGFTWGFQWTASSLWIMIFGMIVYLAYWQIEKARPQFKTTAIGSPRFMLIAVCLTALLGLMFAFGHGLLPDLHSAITGDSRTELLTETENGDVAAVVKLLEEGADPNVQTEFYNSPLFWSVCNGDPAITDALLRHGADVNIKSRNGVTPLMVACLKGDLDTVKLLISKGANVNQRDAVSGAYSIWPKSGSINWPGEQMTPLMLAASQGYHTVVGVLLEAGAEPNLRDKAGKNAAELALEKKYYELHDVISLYSSAGFAAPSPK